jgi:hypothetical protein
MLTYRNSDRRTAAVIVDESTLTDFTGATDAIIVDLRTYNPPAIVPDQPNVEGDALLP